MTMVKPQEKSHVSFEDGILEACGAFELLGCVFCCVKWQIKVDNCGLQLMWEQMSISQKQLDCNIQI